MLHALRDAAAVVLGGVLVGLSLAVSPLGAKAAGCTGQVVTPSTNLQQAVDAAPAGTAFCFQSGTYSNASIAPKTGDVFDGQDQRAVLDGKTVTQYAFKSATAANVTIRMLVIQNYNTPLQMGAIQSFGATGWTIDSNHITKNAGSGVATDSGAAVINNLIDWNRQQGYAAHGSSIRYENNQISYNNHDLTIDPTWEAGGGKAWSTTNAVFKSNYVHDNGGVGLWDDTNNIYTTYEGNWVANNWGAGIYHEIGYDAKIINNTLISNGMPSSPGDGQRNGWLWDAGIQLRSSGALSAASPILISGNTVTNNYNGISLLESPVIGCATPKYGPCHVQNVLVQNNTITMSQGGTGAAQDGEGNGIYTTRNNRFVNNAYHVGNPATHPNDGYAFDWFAWNNNWRSWTEWQGCGNDTTGSFGP